MRFAFIICCLFVFSAHPVLAAADSSGKKHTLSPRKLDSLRSNLTWFTENYEKALRRLYQKTDGTALNEVINLRSYYSKTRQYTPFAKPILDRLTGYAKVIEESQDRKISHETLGAYKLLLNKHLVNFEVLDFAIMMSRVDARFGDTAFLNTVRDSLIAAFVFKNRGLTPDRAHHIVSYGEETYLLEQIGGKVTKSKIYEVGKRYFNVHDLITKDGEYIQVYMDVTEPIVNVINNQIIFEKEESVSIPRN